MPIEFQCPSCNHRLRVPDEAAGKQAQCPECQAINSVPMEPANPLPDRNLPSPFSDEQYASLSTATTSENPFATPAMTNDYQTGALNQVAPWPNPKLQAAYSVSSAWNLFRRHALIMIGAFVLVYIMQQVLEAIQQQTMIALSFGGGPQDPAETAVFAAAMFCVMVLRLFVQTFFSVGLVRINLEIARGRTPKFGLLVSGGPWLLRCAGATVLYWLMVILASIALIVPGVYLGMKFWPYMHFIVDKDCTIREAFSRSSVATQHNMGETLIMMLIAVGLFILGLLMLCLGLFVTMPIIGLAWTIGYLMITAQPFYQANRPQI